MATQTFDMLDTDVVSFVNNSETNDVEMLKLNDNVIWEKYSHIALQVQRVKNSRNEIGFNLSFKTQIGNKYKYKIDNGEWTEKTSNDYNSSLSVNVSDFNVHTIDVVGNFYEIESINQAPEQTTGHFYPNIKILNLSQNHLDEVGFYELGRRLTLDKSIEEIELSQMKMGKEENGGLKYFLKGIGNCKLTNIKYSKLLKCKT